MIRYCCLERCFAQKPRTRHAAKPSPLRGIAGEAQEMASDPVDLVRVRRYT
jgi:hypothetical protein